MKYEKTLPWIEPLEALARLHPHQNLTLLYSALREQNTGKHSYLAWQSAFIHAATSFDDLPPCDNEDDITIPQWFGYVGYPMRHDVEANLTKQEKPPIVMPDMLWLSYRHLLRFNHETLTLDYFTRAETPEALEWLEQPTSIEDEQITITELSSVLSRSAYETAVAKTVEEIRGGNFYQANITRKFYGSCENAINARACFTKLCAISPAPYSALMIMGERAIISSSPEGFVGVDAARSICSRPIKGSAARAKNASGDIQAKEMLAGSAKNLAENLMIVDLMRNDLARICKAGTVNVVELAKLYSYRTIHHLISNITGILKPKITHGDILRATFPPGSMTGAPKIAAMNWCAAQEPCERGAYSGIIGWLGADAQCDFSVLIRTIIVAGNRFEFQVGGGIVADSTPADEWYETIIKARALCEVLGIKEEALCAL